MSFDSVKSQMEQNKMNNQPPVQEFPTGAKRGTDHADCDLALIPPEAIRAYGRAFAEGRKKYGTHNWLKGFPQLGVINHALQHLYSYLEGDRNEDHLGHAMWNIGTAIHQQKYRPDLMDLPPYESTRTDNVIDAEFDVVEETSAEHVSNNAKQWQPIAPKTAKQIVLEHYPHAQIHKTTGGSWRIDPDPGDDDEEYISDACSSSQEAWRSALNRIHESQCRSAHPRTTINEHAIAP